MKTLSAVISFVVLAFTSSCTSDKATQSERPKEETIDTSAQTDVTVSSESTPSEAVIDFLNWYSHNRSSLASNHLVNNADGEVFDSTKFYSVNFKATKEYLSRLKESGFVSEIYLNNWKQYFRQAEEHFQANPQNDGAPEGFEYDFVLLSQEIDEDLANTNKAKVLSNSIQNTKATVVLQLASGQKLRFFLTKQKHHWRIDKVEQANG